LLERFSELLFSFNQRYVLALVPFLMFRHPQYSCPPALH
jgi:hypothetical protein